MIPDSVAGQKASPVIPEVVKLPVVDSEITENTIAVQNANNPTTVPHVAIEIEFNGMIIRIHNKARADVIQSALRMIGGNAHAW